MKVNDTNLDMLIMSTGVPAFSRFDGKIWVDLEEFPKISHELLKLDCVFDIDIHHQMRTYFVQGENTPRLLIGFSLIIR